MLGFISGKILLLELQFKLLMMEGLIFEEALEDGFKAVKGLQ